MKAIIIGAGIGGLCTALMLQKVGIEATIYERAQTVRADGAGLSIWANALRVLDVLGVGETIRANAVTQGKGALRQENGTILTQAEYDATNQETLAIVVHRSTLHEQLLAALKTPLCTGRELLSYEQDEHGVRVYFKDGSHDFADVLIAAEGLQSPIRLQMQPNTLPIYSGYGAWRGVVDFEHNKMGGIWGESWGKGQRFGITPIGKNRVYWFAVENQPENARFSGEQSKAHLLKNFAKWHHPIPEFIAETPADAILYHPINDIEPLEAWVDGRVVLVGDAAHAMTPNMGQGACQAIEDAYALGAFLAKYPLEQALQAYEDLRLPRAVSIMQRSRQIGRVGQLENGFLCWLRDTALKLLPAKMRDSALDAVIQYDIVVEVANS